MLVDKHLSEECAEPIFQEFSNIIKGPQQNTVTTSFSKNRIVQFHGHSSDDEEGAANVKQLRWFAANDTQQRLNPTDILTHYTTSNSSIRSTTLLCLLLSCWSAPRTSPVGGMLVPTM